MYSEEPGDRQMKETEGPDSDGGETVGYIWRQGEETGGAEERG